MASGSARRAMAVLSSARLIASRTSRFLKGFGIPGQNGVSLAGDVEGEVPKEDVRVAHDGVGVALPRELLNRPAS